MEAFDFIVIGGGSAGYAAARTAREVFAKVAIVDAGTELGGLCILRGCMPSKTLIYSAEVLHLAQHGHLFGLRGGDQMSVDWQALHQRKCSMVDDFKSYRQQQLLSDRFTLFRDRARFVAPDQLELSGSGQRLCSPRILIATGSTVATPPVPGLDLPGIWTSDQVLDIAADPGSVIVLGGGVVACELAQFLARCAVPTTQIQRSRQILKELSSSAAAVVETAMRADGVQLHTDTRLIRIESVAGGFSVHFEQHGVLHTVTAARLVNALGRRPNTSGLGLQDVGVELLPSGHVRVDDHQQTTVKGIYAAGDVAGPHEIVHVAILQGECAARHATGRAGEAVRYSDLTSIVFTDPQIAQVGPSVDSLRGQGLDVAEAEYPFDDHGKSILMEARRGYVKVCAERGTGRILSAECVGKDAGELIHPLAVAVTCGLTARQMLKVQWYHPTLSEIWSYPLEDLL